MFCETQRLVHKLYIISFYYEMLKFTKTYFIITKNFFTDFRSFLFNVRRSPQTCFRVLSVPLRVVYFPIQFGPIENRTAIYASMDSLVKYLL